jgi:adenylate cyclase
VIEMANLERKLAAIMAADVVSYSKFMAKNEDETLHLIKSLQANILTPQIEKHKGKIFKKMGDGYLAEFPSVVDAIKAGISIQNNII